MQPVRKQQETCIFGFSLFSSSFSSLLFLPYAFCLLSAGFPRTPSLHFSLALYMNRPDYNRPALKCIITMMTVITIKHSFNRNNNNNNDKKKKKKTKKINGLSLSGWEMLQHSSIPCFAELLAQGTRFWVNLRGFWQEDSGYVAPTVVFGLL